MNPEDNPVMQRKLKLTKELARSRRPVEEALLPFLRKYPQVQRSDVVALLELARSAGWYEGLLINGFEEVAKYPDRDAI